MNRASQGDGGQSKEEQKQVEIEKKSCTDYKTACSQKAQLKFLLDAAFIIHDLDYNKDPENHCHVCGGTDQQLNSFKCKDCNLWIHRECKELRETTTCNHHDHILSLFFLPDEYRRRKLSCDVCHQQLQDVYWVYFCLPCRFFVHVQCIAADTTIVEDDIDPYSKFNMVQLPVANAAVKLTSRFLKQNGLLTIQNLEPVSNFHEHRLVRLSNENNTDELICDGCVEPILIGSQYYSCEPCSYFLHDTCSHLPKGLELLKHPSHQEHSLHINHPKYFFSVAKCHQCQSETNGWSFECSTDKFILDMKCTFLPADISHKAHTHPLTRISDSKNDCSACGKSFSGSSSYGCTCDKCHFYLGIDCVLLPPKITHKWDKHPLHLMYPPFPENPDDFLCEICEEDVHPKHWIYHCEECDQSFHPHCISRLSENRNIKFGGTIQIAGHSLKLVEKGKYKTYCGAGVCKDQLDKKNSLQCTKCDLHVCRKCALENIESKKTDGVTTISRCNGTYLL